MQVDPANEKPIFLQLAEAIEDNILKGIYAEETQIPSTTELAVVLKINPATANKGVNLLVDEGVVYKKRGMGMFVCPGARKKVVQKRKHAFFQDFVLPLLKEAEKLGFTPEDVVGWLNQSTAKPAGERTNPDERG